MEWKHAEYDISHFVLTGLYILLLFAIGHRMYRLKTTGNLSHLWQRTFMTMLLLGTITRTIFFALQPYVMEDKIQMLNFVNLALNLVPSFFFFSCYLIILFLWAEIYHNAYGGGEKNIQRLRPIYFTVTAVMYLIVITLLGLDWILYDSVHDGKSNVPDASTLMEKILFCFDGGLYITTAIGFVVYGGRFYAKFLHGGPLLTKMRDTVLPKVKILTLLCTLCFVARAVITIVGTFMPLADWVWLDLVYFFCLELIPLILMLVILRPAARPSTKTNSGKSTNSSGPVSVYSPLLINERKASTVPPVANV
jgi:hypothetical protein